MPAQPNMTGDDVREGFRLAATEMAAVQEDIKRIAAESRIKVLDGDERTEFFRGMNQDEFDLLHSLAMSMGPKGLNAMERLMNEAMGIYKQSKAE